MAKTKHKLIPVRCPRCGRRLFDAAIDREATKVQIEVKCHCGYVRLNGREIFAETQKNC